MLGETRTYSFEAITRAIRLIDDGARFIATNPDVTGPSAEGPLPATGSVAALITRATGREPYFVGKPNPMMLRSALNRIEAHSENTVMVGDRMDTDVVAGIEAGLDTILVLTGSTRAQDIDRFPWRPRREVARLDRRRRRAGLTPRRPAIDVDDVTAIRTRLIDGAVTDVIHAEGLVKVYGELRALDGLDLAVPEGTVLGLLGPERRRQDHRGAHPDHAARAGRRARPRWPASTSRREPAEVRARIGLSGQYAAVDEYLTGFENLDMVGRLYGLGRERPANAGPRAARAVRPGRRRRPAGEDLLRRHAPPARPRRRAGRRAAGAVPRRADHRARPAQPHRACGT